MGCSEIELNTCAIGRPSSSSMIWNACWSRSGFQCHPKGGFYRLTNLQGRCRHEAGCEFWRREDAHHVI